MNKEMYKPTARITPARKYRFQSALALYEAPKNAEYKTQEKTDLERMWQSVESAYEQLGLRKIPPFPTETFSSDRLVGWLDAV